MKKKILIFALTFLIAFTCLFLFACNGESVPNDDGDNSECSHDFSAKVTSDAYLKSLATCVSPAQYYYKCTLCDTAATTFYEHGSIGTHLLDENGICKGCAKPYMYFGEFPQSSKDDDVIITETVDERGYYLGSDSNYYAMLSVAINPGAANPQYETRYFKVEPILWLVAEQSDDSLLLICESILTNMPYDTGLSYYKTSAVRQWLNSNFLNSAFTNIEKERIIISEIEIAPIINVGPNEILNDKVFLLDSDESFDLLSKSERSKNPSQYAIGNGTNTSDIQATYGKGKWWLRSPKDSTTVCYVNYDGFIGPSYSDRTVESSFGIVPAMRIQKQEP